MKKLILIFALASVFTLSLFAQEETESDSRIKIERHEEKWSTMTYVNVPVVKILEARDAYVVIYQKNRLGTASTVIPKKWVHGTKEEPSKLRLRTTKFASGALMTVVKDNGDYVREVLTAPLSKSNSVWGVVARGNQLEGTDKDTLEEIEL